MISAVDLVCLAFRKPKPGERVLQKQTNKKKQQSFKTMRTWNQNVLCLPLQTQSLNTLNEANGSTLNPYASLLFPFWQVTDTLDLEAFKRGEEEEKEVERSLRCVLCGCNWRNNWKEADTMWWQAMMKLAAISVDSGGGSGGAALWRVWPSEVTADG